MSHASNARDSWQDTADRILFPRERLDSRAPCSASPRPGALHRFTSDKAYQIGHSWLVCE
jgi:hypothetical protein